MRNVVVPKSYEAFGIVVGMKNFATLGLALMGVLARVWRVIRPTVVEEEEEAMARALVLAEEKKADAELGVVISREEYAGGDDDDGGVAIDRTEYDRRSAVEQLEKTPSEAKPGDASKNGQPLPIRAQLQTQASRLSNPAKKVKKAPKENSKTAAKRKPDVKELEKKKTKKKKATDDIDALFSGLF